MPSRKQILPWPTLEVSGPFIKGLPFWGTQPCKQHRRRCSPEQMAVSAPLVNSPQSWRSLVLACLSQGGLWGAGRERWEQSICGVWCRSGTRGQARLLLERATCGIPWQSRGGDLALCCWGDLGLILGQGTKIPKLHGMVKIFKNNLKKNRSSKSDTAHE